MFHTQCITPTQGPVHAEKTHNMRINQMKFRTAFAARRDTRPCTSIRLPNVGMLTQVQGDSEVRKGCQEPF